MVVFIKASPPMMDSIVIISKAFVQYAAVR